MILALLLLSSLFILPTSQEHDKAGRETSKHKGGNRDKGRSASESVQALQVSTAAGQEEVLKVPPTDNKKLVKTAMCGRPPLNSGQLPTQVSHHDIWCSKVAQCNLRKYPSC